MQRQSLGSPVSKVQAHGGGAKDDTLIVDDGPPKRSKDLFVFSAASTSSSISDNYDHDHKATKPHRLSSPPPLAPDRVVHVIPLLTFLCFLILFLFSHTPSQSDLAQFNGFISTHPAKHINSADDEIGDIRRFIDMRKSDVLAIRSLRDLQEQESRKLGPRSRSHRKIADF